MSITTNINVTTEWTQFCNNGDEYKLHNPNIEDGNVKKTILQFALSATEPVATFKGHPIVPLDGVLHSTFGLNIGWVKANRPTVAVLTI